MGRKKWKQEHNGVTLRSGFEKKVATFLDGTKAKYEYESRKLAYEEPATKRTYTPDFILLDNDIYVEAKGRFTPADRRKMALVIEQNPELDIRLLFMRDNTISRASKTTYSAWCEKRNIKCSVSPTGEIPKDWLKKSKTRSPKKNDD